MAVTFPFLVLAIKESNGDFTVPLATLSMTRREVLATAERLVRSGDYAKILLITAQDSNLEVSVAIGRNDTVVLADKLAVVTKHD